MCDEIKTVGVLGIGVIGASWAALFLSKGLKVLLTDPAPGSKENFEAYLDTAWRTLEVLGLSSSACKTNYEVVDSLLPHLDNIDFIQEVCCLVEVYSKTSPSDIFGLLEWSRKSGIKNQADCGA